MSNFVLFVFFVDNNVLRNTRCWTAMSSFPHARQGSRRDVGTLRQAGGLRLAWVIRPDVGSERIDDFAVRRNSFTALPNVSRVGTRFSQRAMSDRCVDNPPTLGRGQASALHLSPRISR